MPYKNSFKYYMSTFKVLMHDTHKLLLHPMKMSMQIDNIIIYLNSFIKGYLIEGVWLYIILSVHDICCQG